MYLRSLSVRNFRALSGIDVEFTDGVNVIVGPNAVGKTTILEAIRLAKAVLFQRTINEPTHVLQSLGASTPHNPQQIISGGLVQDESKDLEIRCGYQLTREEIDLLTNSQEQIVTRLVQNRLGQPIDPAKFSAYLSSPVGQQTLLVAKKEVSEGLDRVINMGRVCRADLLINFKAGQMNAPDPIGPALLSFLDQSLPPDRTKFSYFPADRALPKGDIPVQLGAQEAAQQLEAHNSQPQTKYNRLKNTIFNIIISDENGRANLRSDFQRIFSGVLKGRELVGAGVDRFGLLSIRIRDTDTGREFDIDGLSSGEKGLVLTFLLIGRTLSEDSVVLLDEPELHLNPAVCKHLLSFLIDNYAIPKRLQLIICSHSPEILAGAFSREECSLYHLVSGDLLTPVRQSDQEEVSEALRLLGTSESEGLLYSGTIFFEGEHDVDVIDTGFGGILKNFKLKDLGGRHEVEKHIRSLQKSERDGIQIPPRYFVFDRDDAPTGLDSTKYVHVQQWDRRCLENYLIDINILTDLLKEKYITAEPVRNVGEVGTRLRTFALEHLGDAVIKDVYDSFDFEDVRRRADEVEGKSFLEVSHILFGRISRVQKQIGGLKESEWSDEFQARCAARREELLPVWDIQWRELCNGKRLFRQIQIAFKLRLSPLSFKLRVMSQMRAAQTENWKSVESLLKNLIDMA